MDLFSTVKPHLGVIEVFDIFSSSITNKISLFVLLVDIKPLLNWNFLSRDTQLVLGSNVGFKRFNSLVNCLMTQVLRISSQQYHCYVSLYPFDHEIQTSSVTQTQCPRCFVLNESDDG